MARAYAFEWFPLAENCVVLQISYDSTARAVSAVQSLYEVLCHQREVVSIRPGLDCLVIEVSRPEQIPILMERLRKRQWEHVRQQDSPALSVPVCYEGEFGKDLNALEGSLKMNARDIIELHLSRSYQVWMVGFMPGFAYLGELDPRLHIERKEHVDAHIPAGSVAITEEYVGIYPFDSPGGWHVIGRTPLKLVDYSKMPPCLFQNGAKVQFYKITREQFDLLNKE